MPLSRRAFIRGAAASAAIPAWRRLGREEWSPAAEAQERPDQTGALFQHGVASGDPLSDRVILWTRVTPPPTRSAVGPIETTWQLAADDTLTQVVAGGSAAATPERDFTVKIDAAGLQPGRTYYYAFTAGGQRSPVGRTRTLPTGAIDRLRLAVVSCSNYPAGYFNAYRAIANRPDLDLVVHLGDYIYEFAEGVVYGDSQSIGRVPMVPGEAVTLAEYRLRYATYRSDPDLREAHRHHPFVVVWDDHEIANNAWAGGAESHTAKQGPWPARLAAAYRAYLEWLPIRELPGLDVRLYRSFRIGEMADLIVLDTRGLRDRQVATASAGELNDPSRTLLGAAQEAWLFDQLRASAAAATPWRLLGQQVLFSNLAPTGTPLSTDMWDGYPAARARVLDFLAREPVANVAVLTGDLHSSWALDVPRNPWAAPASPAAQSLAVELVTPAISSPPLFADASLRDRAPLLRKVAPHLRYLEGDSHGYILLDLTRERLQAEFYFVPTVMERTDRERRAATFVCENGSSRLTPA